MNISVSLESILMVIMTGVMGIAIFMLKRWIDRVDARSEQVPTIATQITNIETKQVEMFGQLEEVQLELQKMRQGLSGDVSNLQQAVRGLDIAEIAALNQLVRGGKGGDGGLQYNIVILNAVKHWSRNWTFIAQLTIGEICDALKLDKPHWPELKNSIEEYLVQYQRTKP